MVISKFCLFKISHFFQHIRSLFFFFNNNGNIIISKLYFLYKDLKQKELIITIPTQLTVNLTLYERVKHYNLYYTYISQK